MLLMLEDDPERIQRFTETLMAVAPCMPLMVWRSATRMIHEVEPFLPAARLISLKHDLEPAEGETEGPGDGIDVARFLSVRPEVCPVIIHSSNGSRSDWMIGEFELGGWKYKRVAPTRLSGFQPTAASLWSRRRMDSGEGVFSPDSPKTSYSHICNRNAPSMSVNVGVTLSRYHGRSRST
jgi:hypothetical protein